MSSGPLADVGLHIVPRVTLDGYLAAGAAGIVCVALLVLPAVLAARGFAAEQGGLSRQETRTFGQRMGLDIALLAVTGIALWQLRLYGAPLTSTVQGSLGLDPLLVAAPAIGLLAGGVLALRILPLLAQGVEKAVSRGRDLVASLGSRQLARRPLRYTRSALLLMLAMSMGVFALSYAATWSTSQRDQAAYQSGADVRVLPGRSLSGLPAWALPGAYAGLASIEQASPVERIPNGISFAAAGSADLLALDADTAAGIVLLRADESTEPLSEHDACAARGPPGTAPRHAARRCRLPAHRAAPRRSPRSVRFDPNTGDPLSWDLDPAALSGVRVSASAIVRDAHGLLYRVESGLVPMDGPTTALVLPLERTEDRSADVVAQLGARLDGPVELAGLGVDLWLPGGTSATDGLVGVAEVSAGADPAGPWTDVPLAAIGAWRAKMAQGLQALGDVPAGQTRGHRGGGRRRRTTRLHLRGRQRRSVRAAWLRPRLRRLVGRCGAGDRQSRLPGRHRVGAGRHHLGHRGGRCPTPLDRRGGRRASRLPIRDARCLILDEPTLGLLRLQGTSSARSADEWWMAATDGDAEALTGALRSRPVRQRRRGDRRRPHPQPQH